MPDDQPEAQAPAVPLCEASALVERGVGVRFDLLWHGERVSAFALRIDGQPVAYLNRCRHIPVELDWQPGRFLDETGQWIICAMHGATYHTRTGMCAGGPCRGKALVQVALRERDGHVYWYPSTALQPLDHA